MLPFERCEEAVLENSDEEHIVESTVREEEYGPETTSAGGFDDLGQVEESKARGHDRPTETQGSRIQEELSVQEHHVSVLEGLQLDQTVADQWLTDVDHLRPKVIADHDEEDDDCNSSILS